MLQYDEKGIGLKMYTMKYEEEKNTTINDALTLPTVQSETPNNNSSWYPLLQCNTSINISVGREYQHVTLNNAKSSCNTVCVMHEEEFLEPQGKQTLAEWQSCVNTNQRCLIVWLQLSISVCMSMASHWNTQIYWHQGSH